MTESTPSFVLGPFSGQRLTAAWVSLAPDEPDASKGVYVGPDGGAGCWTYRDEAGYGPSLSRTRDRHPTAERALEAALAQDLWLTAQGKPFETRAAYEAEARRLGLVTRSDADCAAMAWGDWDLDTYGITGAAERTLASRRGLHLQEAARRLSADDQARVAAELRAAALEERAGDAEDAGDLGRASKLRSKAQAR